MGLPKPGVAGQIASVHNKAKQAPYRQVLPSAALKIFDVYQYAGKCLPCIRRTFARKSARLAYVGRPWNGLRVTRGEKGLPSGKPFLGLV